MLWLRFPLTVDRLYVFLPLIVLQTTYIITLFIYMRTLVLGLKLVVMSWALGVGLLLTALIVVPLKLDGNALQLPFRVCCSERANFCV